jgi:hypothetical protein
MAADCDAAKAKYASLTARVRQVRLVSGTSSPSRVIRSADAMTRDDPVDTVYGLLAQRSLAASVAAWRIARAAISEAQDARLLALHEAITDALSALLIEIAEHALQNQASWGIAPDEVDVEALSNECHASWNEVKRLRGAGLTSEALTSAYVGGWMTPIGSRDWLDRMRLGVPHRHQRDWIERARRIVRGEPDED